MDRRNWLEWLVLGVSVVGIVALVTLLVVDGLTGGGRPPAPIVELQREEAHESELGWMVPAVLRNEGDEVAEAVMVEAAATVGDSEEVSEVSVDFLPPGSSVDVTFAFSAEPTGEIEVRLVGYRLP